MWRDVSSHTGDDFLEAETIMRDVVQRRRRVFGSAHPDTLLSERTLSQVHAGLAVAYMSQANEAGE